MIALKKSKRYPIQIGNPETYHLMLVGCGGTGSFLALHLARLAYHARERYNRTVDLMFIDPDVVEAKNIGRQNFAPAEVGAHKAEALARRYSLAFGLPIRFKNDVFTSYSLGSWLSQSEFYLIVGAVDNAAARVSIYDRVGSQRNNALWWLDCGNHEHAGQILLGNRVDLEAPEIRLNFCSGLPSPGEQHPELLEARPAPESDEAASCADLTLRDAQSLMINQAMATYAAQYVYRLVVTRDLDMYATYVDLLSGAARSQFITKPEGSGV
jgi:PRTRC genetic system ThiF family protein